MPIEFKNISTKVGNTKKVKKGKKNLQNKSKSFSLPNALKRPGSAKINNKSRPLPEWNENV